MEAILQIWNFLNRIRNLVHPKRKIGTQKVAVSKASDNSSNKITWAWATTSKETSKQSWRRKRIRLQRPSVFETCKRMRITWEASALKNKLRVIAIRTKSSASHALRMLTSWRARTSISRIKIRKNAMRTLKRLWKTEWFKSGTTRYLTWLINRISWAFDWIIRWNWECKTSAI